VRGQGRLPEGGHILKEMIVGYYGVNVNTPTKPNVEVLTPNVMAIGKLVL
jgi:hypothetical protein